MYDTARRVALVKQRVRENTRRRQRRGIYGLSAMCMLLFAVLMQAADAFAVQGQTATWGVFGAILKIFEKFCVLGESFFDFLYLYK